MQSEYFHSLADLCERDRQAFEAKIRFGVATANEMAFYAADESCPESRWREFAFDEEECVRKGLACNKKVTVNYLKSLLLSAEGEESKWIADLIEYRLGLEKIPDADADYRPKIMIRLA